MFVYKLFKSTQFELQNTMASVAALVYSRSNKDNSDKEYFHGHEMTCLAKSTISEHLLVYAQPENMPGQIGFIKDDWL